MQFAQRLDKVETSAIRELFKLLGKPGIISFAGGFPDSAMFDVQGIREASERALRDEPGAALQYGATEGHNPLREQLAAFMQSKGVAGLRADELIVTTGSQQALDLVGKTLLDPQDTVLVESPTFLATIQCFRLYGPTVMGVPIDVDGVDVDALEQMIQQHRPKLVYLVPTFGNPSGAMTSLQRRIRVLELAVKYQTVVVEDDPYGDLYFADAPPPSLLALSAQVPGSRDWLVHCGSLSKVLSPGLRIGWMVAPLAHGGARHHVQAIQRCPHVYIRSSHCCAVFASRAHAGHFAECASGVCQPRPRHEIDRAEGGDIRDCEARTGDEAVFAEGIVQQIERLEHAGAVGLGPFRDLRDFHGGHFGVGVPEHGRNEGEQAEFRSEERRVGKEC